MKPEFFHNEALAKLDPNVGKVYQGLWSVADRDGLLIDNVSLLKGFIMPYNTRTNIEAILQKLHDHRFIVRYEYSGGKYIWIPMFVKHQPIHKNEAKSKLFLPDSIKKKFYNGSVETNGSVKPPIDKDVQSTDPPKKEKKTKKKKASKNEKAIAVSYPYDAIIKDFNLVIGKNLDCSANDGHVVVAYKKLIKNY